MARSLDSVHAGHAHVEQHELRVELLDGIDGRLGPEPAPPTQRKPGSGGHDLARDVQEDGWSSTPSTATSSAGAAGIG